MKTLHHCHWQSMEHLASMKKLIGREDVLVFYGNIDAKTWRQISRQLPNYQHFIVNSDDCLHNNTDSMGESINHRQWASLIVKHRRVFAWK